MYMRLVQFRVNPEELTGLRGIYERKVIPALQQIPGCLSVRLIQNVDRKDECISMTFWRDKETADEYERTGAFRRLIDEVSPYLEDSADWKIQLSDDLTLEYKPSTPEPAVSTFVNVPGEVREPVPEAGSLFVRLVSPQIRPGKVGEFKELYQEHILPRLQSVRGCRYAYLMEDVRQEARVISVTVWDSKEDAENYEKSGVFDTLKDKVAATFSEIYQWKMQLERESTGQVTTTEEMSVEGYTVVTGKAFV